MSKVDYLLSSSRYRAFKISVFLAQKNKNYKIGEAEIKSNQIIWELLGPQVLKILA